MLGFRAWPGLSLQHRLKRIESRDNPLVGQLRRLAESSREGRRTGMTLLEGLHLVLAYEAALGAVETLVVNDRGLGNSEIASYLRGREVVVLSDALFRALGDTETPSGLLAVAAIPSAVALPAKPMDCVLLDGVQDPGNLGTLLRTAAAAGFSHVLMSSDCAAPWAPKVMRAGQGAHFALHIHDGADLMSFLAAYRGTVAATTLTSQASLWEAAFSGPIAWVFGSEGRGVRPELLELAGMRLHIPMAGGVESLNVAAAAAICLFETRRQRSRNS